MGNGVSTDQGNLPVPSHDQRDVSASAFEEQHDWSEEQAEAPEIHSLSTGGKPYNGAQAGLESRQAQPKTASSCTTLIIAPTLQITGTGNRR